MDDCVFCRIIAGELPSTKLHDDAEVMAFLDIEPQAPTHIIVVPKVHIDSLAELTAENSAVAARCLEVIAQLGKSEGLDGGYRVITNIGVDGGQTVKHLHFHILAKKKMSALM